MLQQLSDEVLAVSDFFLVLSFFNFKFLSEFVDFLFFLIEDFVFLFVTLVLVFFKVSFDFFNVLFVGVHCLLHIHLLLFKLLQFNIILFNAVLKSFSGLVQRKIEIVGLELQVIFLLD